MLGDGVEDREEFVFAVEAAIGGVGSIRGIFHLVGLDEFMMDVLGADEVFDDVAIVRGVTGRKGGDRKRAIAESFLRGPCEVGRIGSAGQRHDDGRNPGELCQQLSLFFSGGWAIILRDSDLDDCGHMEISV